MSNEHIQSDYLDTVLVAGGLKKHVCNILKTIKKHRLKFDAIAVRGCSGMLVGAPVAMKLGKSLIIVRKNESTHAAWDIEGDIDCNSFIIIDDFILTGDTVKEIHTKVIQTGFNKEQKCLGAICYSYEYADYPVAGYEHANIVNLPVYAAANRQAYLPTQKAIEEPKEAMPTTAVCTLPNPHRMLISHSRLDYDTLKYILNGNFEHYKKLSCTFQKG